MNTEIKQIIDRWSDETEKALLDNLQRRKVVGQRLMIKNIKIDTQQIGEDFSLSFVFEREKQTVKEAYNISNRQKVGEIYDPLFKTYKPFSRKASEISFTRKANIFESLKGKYFDKLIEQVTAVDAEFARKLVARTLIK